METIKSIRWYRCPVKKDVMSRLMQKSNLRGLTQITAQFLLTAFTGVCAYWAWHHLPWYAVIPVLFIHGTIFSFLSFNGCGHELSHKTVFQSVALNEFFMKLTSFLSWTDYIGFRYSHIKHHQATLFTGLDGEVTLPRPMPKALDWFWMLTINVFGTWGIRDVVRMHLRHIMGKMNSPWEDETIPASNQKLRAEHRRWAWTVLVGQFALAALFIYFKEYSLLFIVTLAPFTATWLNVLCERPQHAGLSPNVPDFRLNCRTMILSPLVSFLYWRMNYHIEHHMYPAIPFFNLSHLREEIQEELPPPSRGLIGTWREILAIAKRQEKEPGYTYTPPVPDPVSSRSDEFTAEAQ